MFMITIDYPSEAEELEIIRRTTSAKESKLKAVLNGADVLRVQELVRQTPVAEHVARYALRLVRATRVREHTTESPKPAIVAEYLAWGAGPRASQYLILGAKAHAVLAGRFHVTPEDIQAVARPVLRHRLITNFNAEADNITTDDVINSLLDTVPVEGESGEEKKQLDAVML
jgi:MoxR-like ATPase